MPKKEDLTFTAEALEDADILQRSEEIVEEVVEKREKAKQKTTPKGYKSKEAKEAEVEEILANTLQSVLTGVNKLLEKAGDELKHDDAEIKTISELGAPVLNKYVDLEAMKYKEEMALGSYLLMCEMPKIEAFAKRKAKERKQKRKEKQNGTTANNNDLGQARKRKKSTDQEPNY